MDWRMASSGVKMPPGRRRARRLNKVPVDVTKREEVSLKMSSVAAARPTEKMVFSSGKLRIRKSAAEQKRILRDRAAGL